MAEMSLVKANLPFWIRMHAHCGVSANIQKENNKVQKK